MYGENDLGDIGFSESCWEFVRILFRSFLSLPPNSLSSSSCVTFVSGIIFIIIINKRLSMMFKYNKCYAAI